MKTCLYFLLLIGLGFSAVAQTPPDSSKIAIPASLPPDSTAVDSAIQIPPDTLGTVPRIIKLPDDVETRAVAFLMSLLNLVPSDIHFRPDYTEEDYHRLATISELMASPYDMTLFADELLEAGNKNDSQVLLKFAFDNLAVADSSRERYGHIEEKRDAGVMNTFYTSDPLNRFLGMMHDILSRHFPAGRKTLFEKLSDGERIFLRQEFRQIVMEDTADEMKTVEAIDSIEKAEEKYVDQFVGFGKKINKDPLLYLGYIKAGVIAEIIATLQKAIAEKEIDPNRVLKDTVYMPKVTGAEFYLGKQKGWKISGPGDDFHSGDFTFILDLGGNDKYDLAYDPANPHDVVIIDLGGNDIYNAITDFALGSGCFGVGLLYDMDGHDVYNGKNFSCGSGYFGLGMIYDAAGHDCYYGDTHCQGAGTFGIGAIIDRGGSDVYSAAIYSQGFGFVEGFGIICDILGNDNYMAGNKYKDILRYDDHYLSLSQGFGYGIRPGLSGGIGTILDFAGNDNYISDIFGQGASYWWSLGVIYDKSGNDQYISYQYAQGSAAHMSLGFLRDDGGDDFYRGKGLMQGVGHDYSCGFIQDREGNDIYQADDLSQGAGSANGIGILMDDKGDDAYYVLKKHNTQGYGNPRRDFGSIGLFLDLGGRDRYDGNGADSSLWKTDSKWGGGVDGDFFDVSDKDTAQGE